MKRRRDRERERGPRRASARGVARVEERGWSRDGTNRGGRRCVGSPVFDFVLTCRHYGIRFGQPPVEKAPSWSWISITVVMATAIDSTGVRAVEENGENDRARPRDAAQGYSRMASASERIRPTDRNRESQRGRERGNDRERERERERRRERPEQQSYRERSNGQERSTEGMVLLWWCYTVLALSDTIQTK